MEVQPQALPVGIGIFADDTHHFTPLFGTVYGSKYSVYPASQLAQGFICVSGRYIRHVQSILVDVDEFARDSTHIRVVFHCIGQVRCS